MDFLNRIDTLLVEWGLSAETADKLDHFIALAIILGTAFLANLISRKILLRAIASMVKKSRATWDDIVFDPKVTTHLSRMVAPIIIYMSMPAAFADVNAGTLDFIRRICLVYIIVAFLAFVNAFLKAIYSIYNDKEQFRNRPLKGLLQTLQVMLWLVGGIVIVGELIGRDPLSLLAGLGASAAILMLVFKDSIMGFVSGIQLSANDMLRVGDWIAMPKHGADGVVTEVTLNTVKVRNWDNTVTTVPPYLLVSDSFQNWRGMQESGGRRVKRSINIDMNSIRFCDKETLAKLKDAHLLRTPAVGQEHPTNLGLFRTYLTDYLKALPYVNADLHCMVRYLQPTEHGMPVELYFFSRKKEWIPYEGVLADVFDHVLAVIPEFGLKVFQSPSGTEVRELSHALRQSK